MKLLSHECVSAKVWCELLALADMSTASVESISPCLVFALQRHGSDQLQDSLNEAFARASSASEAGALRMWTLLSTINATLGSLRDKDGLVHALTKTLIRGLGCPNVPNIP